MKAVIGFCRRPLTGAMMVGMLAIGSSAFGQEIRFFPIRSAPIGSPDGTIGAPITPTFNAAIGCWEYAIDAGGVEVDIDVQGGGWGNADAGTGPVGPLGGPALGAIQATVLSAGYSNGVGADIGPKGGLGAGFYRADSVCGAGGDGSPCSPPFDGTCSAGGGFCVPNTNQIFQAPGMNANALCAIAVPTLNYGYACAAQEVGNTFDQNPGGFSTFGGLILDVPAGAAGTYVIGVDPDPNNSFMTAGTGAPILGVQLTGACITVITGKCCSNIGAGTTVCESDLTLGECNLRPGPRKFNAGEACTGDVEADCPACEFDVDCSDGNACTTDTCVKPPGEQFGACAPSVPNYDDAVDCCDPATGALTAIDDGDVCTDDSCDAATGGVAHDPNTGAACDDGFACTSSDTCNAGVCEGTDVNTIPCTVDDDCPLGECGAAGLCECSEDTPLLCTISNAANAENCFADGEPVEVAIGIGAGSEIVYGAQFFLQYSADCLTFVDLGACEGTVFDSVIEWEHDAAAGTIWYAVTIDPDGDLAGTPGPEDVLCINFTYAGGCEGCTPSVTFDSVNPRNTRLSNNTGNPVPTITSDCKGIRGLGEITLNTPDDVDVNADCGLPSAIVNWDAPSATDTCDGDLTPTVVCIAEHTEGYDISGLLVNGGEFPQGTAFFRCEASNSCGDTAVDVWTVDVSDQHGLEVEVHLSPAIVGDNFERAIQFQLYNDCFSDPTEICEVMTFGGPYNFNGHARSTLKVDKGNYQCITARDCLHTLRSAADVFCEDNGWKAIFKGDPLQGGNWLVGGNLDCWKQGGAADTIDILDAGIYLSVIAGNQGSTSPGANTDCDTEGPHADINADGVVDSADYSFVIENFLAASKDACCPQAEAPIEPGRTSYSVTELRKMGFGDLASGDLNGDGFLDMTDLDLYSQGVQPTPLYVPASKRGASSSR